MLRHQLSGSEKEPQEDAAHAHWREAISTSCVCLVYVIPNTQEQWLLAAYIRWHTFTFRRDSRRRSKHVRPRSRDSIAFLMHRGCLASDQVDRVVNKAARLPCSHSVCILFKITITNYSTAHQSYLNDFAVFYAGSCPFQSGISSRMETSSAPAFTTAGIQDGERNWEKTGFISWMMLWRKPRDT